MPDMTQGHQPDVAPKQLPEVAKESPTCLQHVA